MGFLVRVGELVDSAQRQFPALPPVKLGVEGDIASIEPFLVAQRGEEVAVGMLFLDLENGGIRQVIIVRMGDDYDVDDWNVLDFTRGFGVPLGPHPLEGTASILENRVKQHPQASRKLDVVAGVA
jgi:hypothetical protein